MTKLKGHIALGLSPRPSVRPPVPYKLRDMVLIFHRWTHSIKNNWIISLCGVMPLLKGHNEILLSGYFKNYNS